MSLNLPAVQCLFSLFVSFAESISTFAVFVSPFIDPKTSDSQIVRNNNKLLFPGSLA